jgi:DNA-directed RNA polymerase subunit RPC12/RpoP
MKIKCSKCGHEVGQTILIQGEELLQIGSLLIAELRANCIQCGEGFFYSITEKKLERLIRKIQDHNKYSSKDSI